MIYLVDFGGSSAVLLPYPLTFCGFISVAEFVTVNFPSTLNVMRYVNVIIPINSQLNKTAVMRSAFLAQILI